jgi:hypothetical protein
MRRQSLTMLLLMMCAGTPLLAQTKTKVIVTITGLVTIADTVSAISLAPKTLYLMDTSHAPAAHHVVPHIGVILAEDDYGTKTLDGRPLHNEGGVARVHHWVALTGAEKISVKGGSTTPLAYVDEEPASICPAATDAIRKSLYFFPRLSRVSRKQDGTSPGRNDFATNYLSPKKGDHTITAWMDVTFGRLDADVKSDAVWSFKASPNSVGSTHQQLTADSATWTFEIAGDTLVLQTSTDGATPVDFLELHADGDGKIRFTLANAPNEPEHIGVQLLAGLQFQRRPPVDEHFALYYEYLSQGVQHDGTTPYVRNIPVIAGVCVDTTFSTDLCDIRNQVNIPDPGNCPAPPAALKRSALVLVGEVNCGPDHIP